MRICVKKKRKKEKNPPPLVRNLFSDQKQLEYRNLHILLHQHPHRNPCIFQLQIHLQDTNFVARGSPCASIY